MKNKLELGTVNPAYENDTGRHEDEKYTPRNKIPTVAAQVETSLAAGDHEPRQPQVNGVASLVIEQEDTSQRQQWNNGVEFLMSCIAMSVGLGNVWRFPFTAFNNGGGAFLIPYIVVLLVIGKPIYYMEMALGQFISGGPVKAWNISPALKGLGYGQIFATTLVLTYYCSLMALTVFYLYNSFASELPWSTCDPSWTDCFHSKKGENSSQMTNRTGMKSSSELYFYKSVLNEKSSIEDGIGAPDLRLTLCLFISWATIFIILVKGVRSSGKAAYFLALFPYVVLITLLIRGCTLPGAIDGIRYFFEPKWEELLNPKVWFSAVTQAFFSLGICFGAIIMYSSYNGFQHNVYRDALIVTSLDTFTSLLAGSTIFAILGNVMYETGNDDIRKVVQGGTGLAFVSYPDAIAKFDIVPQFFSVVFFLMLYALGIGSAVALAAAVISVVSDKFPDIKYWMITLAICTIGFLVGLVYITPGGQYILTLVDFYGANFTVFILAALEMVGIAWIYGMDNFCQDLEFMVGRKIGCYWRICWGIITPVLMIVILLYSIGTMKPETYKDKPFPTPVYAAGWVLFSFGVLQFPIWAIVAFVRNNNQQSLFQVIKDSFQASKLWAPANSKTATEWKRFKEERKGDIPANETLREKLYRIYLGRTSY